MFRVTSITLKLDPFRDGFYFCLRFFSLYFYSRISKDIIFTVAIIIVTLLGMIKIVRASLTVLNHFIYSLMAK